MRAKTILFLLPLRYSLTCILQLVDLHVNNYFFLLDHQVSCTHISIGSNSGHLGWKVGHVGLPRVLKTDHERTYPGTYQSMFFFK